MNRTKSTDRWEAESPKVMGIGWPRLAIIATVIIVVVAGFFTIRAIMYAHTHVKATRASIEGMIIAVGPRSGGRVIRLLAKPGQEVEAGEEIAWLDKEALEQGIREAQAQLSAAQAQVSVAEADLQRQTRLTQGGMRVGTAGVEVAQSRYKQAGIQAALQNSNSKFDVEQARTALTQAEKRLARLRSGARPQEIEGAKAGLRAAEARLGAAQNDLKRKEKLFGDGYVSAGQVENARAQADVTQAERDQAAQTLELLKAGNRKEDLDLALMEVDQAKDAYAAAKARAANSLVAAQQTLERAHEVSSARASLTEAAAGHDQVAMAQRQVRAAVAQVAIAQAGLDAAVASLRGAYVKSPVSGVVEEILIHEGEIVAPGQPVALVVSKERYWIQASIPETDVLKVRPEQPVEIELQAYEDQIFTGKVTVVGRATVTRTKASGSPSDSMAAGQGFAAAPEVPVTIEFDYDKALNLTPGMSARVIIDVTGNN